MDPQLLPVSVERIVSHHAQVVKEEERSGAWTS